MTSLLWRRIRACKLALLCASIASIASASMSRAAEMSPQTTQSLPQIIEFNRDIRPILSDNCFPCHGPDEAKRKRKLRFDIEAGAFADLGGRRAIVPGNLQQSEMFRRITSEDETERMPHVSS